MKLSDIYIKECVNKLKIQVKYKLSTLYIFRGETIHTILNPNILINIL